MGHDAECELLPVPGYPSPRDTCHCATRAYVRDPYRPDGGPVVPHPHASGDLPGWTFGAHLAAAIHDALSATQDDFGLRS